MKKLFSVFTSDMNRCFFTGSPIVERHHVLSHTHKERMLCEKYGFIIPLRPDLHPNGVHFKRTPENLKIDGKLKAMCQRYYEEHIGTREEWMQEFYKNYL